MFEQFDVDDKDIFKVCVIATMSSGKSTFINAIIGDEIMPEKNEACTARTMAVLDNDTAVKKKVHIIRKDGSKELVEADNREVLERINNDESVVDFLVETNIQNIKNTSRALILVDTPGVNNSGDERHGERTDDFLKQMDMGVIIYLMNATQLATNDDSILLRAVSDHVKKQNGMIKIIFVINKIDSLDLEAESILGTVRGAKEYIENHGIKNPVIYPLSALSAKIMRMALYRKEMTRREIRKLEDIYDTYRSRDNNMLAYAIVDDVPEEIYEIGESEVTAQELQRAIDNTGISAIERKLETFMMDVEQRYEPKIVIKSRLSENAVQKYQERLNAVAAFPSFDKSQQFEAINQWMEKADALQKENKQISDTESVTTLMDITSDTAVVSNSINNLVTDLEAVKKNLYEVFRVGKYVPAGRIQGLFFGPEKRNERRINAKNFYLMSEDGSRWTSVQFGRMVRLVDEGKKFFLYNDYSSFLFSVTKENGTDVIALLDTKLPVGFVKLAGKNKDQVSIEDVKSYVNDLILREEKRKKEISDAKQQLERTYKGVVFEKKVEKDKIIRIEKDIQQYCKASLDKECFEDIWRKKEQISRLPQAIFAPYMTRLISGLEIKEAQEEKDYLKSITDAKLDDLSKIQEKIGRLHYSESAKVVLGRAIDKRRYQCQETILENLTSDMDGYSKEHLRRIAEKIKAKQFDPALTTEYIGRVGRQYDIAESRELRDLCQGIDQKNLQELEKLEYQINSNCFQEKYTGQYFEQIRVRREVLHLENMEKYCQSIASIDREELEVVRHKVDNEKCKLELKQHFYDLIAQREEELDYKDLCAITEDLETKTLYELEDLYKQLQNGNYNEKFIKVFLLRVRVYMELAQQKYVNELIKNLRTINKKQVYELQHKIEAYGYPDRVVSIVKEKVRDRLYTLDMHELIEWENDFDHLSLNDIHILRKQLMVKNVSERSRQTYEKKLYEREYAIAFEKVYAAAAYAQKMLEKLSISWVDIKLAVFSSDYWIWFDDFKKKTGSVDFQNIPVFFFPDCSMLAVTKTDLYCMVNSRYCRASFSEITSITYEKKFLTDALLITFKNGNMIRLSGGVSKKNAKQLANFLGYVIQNVNNSELSNQFQPYTYQVKGFEKYDFDTPQIDSEVTEKYIVDLFLFNYQALEQSKGKISSIKYAFQDDWGFNVEKVCNGFGIVNERQLVLYYDKTLLKSAKEGIAVGLDAIYMKKSNQNVVSIPYTDIYEIVNDFGKIGVVTTTNKIFTTVVSLGEEETKKCLVRLLDEFVKGIQMVNPMAVKNREYGEMPDLPFEEDEEDGSSTEERVCPKCNYVLKPGVKFCSNCGAKIADWTQETPEYVFCAECGKKIEKGKKFCTNCGAKVIYKEITRAN